MSLFPERGFHFLPAAPAQAGPWLRASTALLLRQVGSGSAPAVLGLILHCALAWVAARRSMHKGYSSCNGASLPIGQVLDELPLSSFHIGHVFWTAAAVALFAIHCELTPYMFPGLQIHFGRYLS